MWKLFHTVGADERNSPLKTIDRDAVRRAVYQMWMGAHWRKLANRPTT